MWTRIEVIIPVIVVVMSLIGSFIGTRIWCRDLLNQATEVLNEQGDKAVLQYKMMKKALDIPVTEPIEPILVYIQQLRDIPEQAGFPEDVEFPEEI